MSLILQKQQLDKESYFLYLGRLVKDKNPDILIKAFIQSGIISKKLVIAGANDKMFDYVENLHQLAAGNEKIIFTGAVYNDDKDVLLQNCFVFCIPSTVEGLSITLLEAMSFERPVLASDIPANREVLGNIGIWVRPENVDDLSEKLIYCEKNIAVLESQKALNYKRVAASYTWDKIAKKYVNYLNSLF